MVCSYSSGPFATTLYSLLPSSWDVTVRQKHDEEEDWPFIQFAGMATYGNFFFK